VREINQDLLQNSLIIGSEKESDVALFANRFVEGETMIFVSKNNTCKLPVKTKEEALKQLSDTIRI